MKRSNIAVATSLGAGVLLLCQGVAHAEVDAQSQRVIRESAAGMHTAALRGVRVMRIDANVKTVGLSGKQTQWISLPSSRFAEFATLPPLEQDDGYDGSVVWNRDQSGLVWNVGGDAARSTEISGAYMSAFGLWQPSAGGARVSYVGLKRDKGGEYDALSVTAPGSKLPVEVWFDRKTHLLAREIQAVGPIVNTVSLSHYRPVHGLMLPYTVHVDNSNGNNADVAITAVAFDPPDGAAKLSRPTSRVHDFSMAGGQTSTTVPADLVDNHVYLDVMLNGKGPFRMIFDTGGANIIDPAVAKEIGALGKGNAQGSGVGAKTESFSFAKVDALQVGEAVLRDQIFAVVPVRQGFGISGGRPADGLIGWEVLARYITTFDYAGKRVGLTLPNAAQVPAGAHVVPFVLNQTQPQIACGIDGIPSQCTIDTGARDTMTFYAPYLAQHPQVRPDTLTANGITGFGVGGASFGQLGRLQSLSIDDLTLNALIADYSSSAQGAFASPFVAANLGGKLLRRFNVTFDYGRQTMALVPNAAFAERDTYERSGLFVVNIGGKMTVVDARPGTPAADAGIVKGDVITAVNGVPTSTMALATLRDYFYEPAGTVLKLGVTSKNGDARTLGLTLRDYV
jgi:Aspartyl protease/PDZ domain